MLLDFHLAQPPVIPGNDPPAWLGGTGPYMSPEQRDALDAVRAGMPIRTPVDARSDIHSLGVLLCECLGFDLGREPGTITPSRLPISRGLADILARCLDPRAERRYASAAEFAEDLRRHMNDLPLRGVPNRSWTERWSKWRRRSPHDLARYGLAVILLGLAVAGAVVVALENVPRDTSLPGDTSLQRAVPDDSRGARTSPAPGEANEGTSEKGVSLEAAEQHRLGRRLLEEGNYQQAQGPLARAVALEPNRLWFRFHQGVCHYRLGELEEAIAAFTASIALSTGRDRAICHLNRGLAHTQAGRDLRAIRDYDTALDLDPTLGAAAMNRGVLHYRRGAWSLAFADLHRALRHGADTDDTLFNLALVHQARGEKRAALDCLALILERTPSHAEAGKLRNQLESR